MNTGEVGYVHLKCRHEFHPDGTRSRTVGMLQDITEREKNVLALQLATKSSEFANRAKSIFLAKVSHEIRTPLTAIVGFSELMEDADLTTEHRKYLDAINSAGNTLSLLINDILDLSKAESGDLVIRKEVFSLQEHIKKMVDIQKQQNTNKNLSFDVSIDPDVPESLLGDPYRIQQIILNLLGNAIKFTEKGSVDLAVSVAEKSVHGILLDITVKDTGIGIPTALQEHIFEPFFKVFEPRSPHYAGSGLGLTISQSLATLMGGTIRLESKEAVGSTFHLLIPLQIKIDNRSEKHLPKNERLHWSGPALKVLLAEDNPINIQLVKAVLENMGHVVTVAENGMAALDILQANTFDLMLMDIQMPLMNGTDALGVLRDQEQISGKHLTVIALTAYALIGDKEKYLKMGFDGYLSKPFTTKALVDELVRVIPRENFAFKTK
jgi:signal transduction histidine kinase/ActR/RegA family two-component response regulator